MNVFYKIALVAVATVVPMSVSADTIKRNMLGCITEDLLDEALGYASKQDTKGMVQLVVSGQCFMLKAGDTVSVIRPGFTVATIRRDGVKLFTPAEAIR